MTLENFTKYVIIAAGIAGVLFLFPFLLNAIAPFAAAFFVATLCQNFVGFLERKFKINRGIGSAIIITVIVVVFLGLIFLAVFQLFSQAKNLLSTLPDTVNAFRSRISELNGRYNGFRLSLPKDATAYVDSFMSGLQEQLNGFSRTIAASTLELAKKFAVALPDIIFFTIMFVLGAFFFTKDYQLIVSFLGNLLPPKILHALTRAKSIVIKAFSSYIKAQLILMLLTSSIITICLLIIGKDYALLWGIICGLVDALPLLGAAAVLIPWAIISFIYGDMYSFIALIIIQLLVFVVRQIAEPRIISRQIGIHPILTLASIYIGLKYFGAVGIILAPIITLLVVNLYITYREEQ